MSIIQIQISYQIQSIQYNVTQIYDNTIPIPITSIPADVTSNCRSNVPNPAKFTVLSRQMFRSITNTNKYHNNGSQSNTNLQFTVNTIQYQMSSQPIRPIQLPAKSNTNCQIPNFQMPASQIQYQYKPIQFQIPIPIPNTIIQMQYAIQFQIQSNRPIQQIQISKFQPNTAAKCQPNARCRSKSSSKCFQFQIQFTIQYQQLQYDKYKYNTNQIPIQYSVTIRQYKYKYVDESKYRCLQATSSCPDVQSKSNTTSPIPANNTIIPIPNAIPIQSGSPNPNTAAPPNSNCQYQRQYSCQISSQLSRLSIPIQYNTANTNNSKSAIQYSNQRHGQPIQPIGHSQIRCRQSKLPMSSHGPNVRCPNTIPNSKYNTDKYNTNQQFDNTNTIQRKSKSNQHHGKYSNPNPAAIHHGHRSRSNTVSRRFQM